MLKNFASLVWPPILKNKDFTMAFKNRGRGEDVPLSH